MVANGYHGNQSIFTAQIWLQFLSSNFVTFFYYVLKQKYADIKKHKF